MTVRTPDRGFIELEQRYEKLGRVLPYVLLGVPLIPYVLSQNPTTGAFLITLGLAALAAAWITWMIILRPSWTQHRWLVVLFFAGLVVFIWLLTVRSPWFAFFGWIGFIYAFEYLPGVWRWVGCVPVAVPFAVAQTGGFHQPTAGTVAIWVILTFVDIGLVGGLVLLGHKTEEQNLARKGMIAELAEANQRLEQIMAENTGLQAQLLVQAREAGAGDERQRMAREIHDTLAQGLTGIITQLEAAQQTASDTERDRRIGNATRLARDSLAEARRSVQALRPKALEDSRLPDALAGEVARWSVTSGVTAEVRTTGEAHALHPEVEVTLLRVAQEALANVAKHADASRAWITLSYMGDVVTLDVRDDGTGFDPALTPQSDAGGGFGLIAMRQRVQRMAGQLEIESEPGVGTVVSASLPAIGLGPPPQAAVEAPPPQPAVEAPPPQAAVEAPPPQAAVEAPPPQAAVEAESS